MASSDQEHHTESPATRLVRLLREADTPEAPLGDPGALAWELGSAAASDPLPALEALVHFLRLGHQPLSPKQKHIIEAFLQALAQVRMRAVHEQRIEPWSDQAVELLGLLYGLLRDQEAAAHWVLTLLATDSGQRALGTFADLVVTQGPQHARACDLAFMPLFLHHKLDHQALFPRLWEALDRPHMVGCILDLANYLFRKQITPEHVGQMRKKGLLELYRGLINHLEDLQTNPQKYASDTQKLRQLLNESVPLVVSLTDAMGLLGLEDALPLVRRAAELSHRRVQAEAAAALVRLGDEQGQQILQQLLHEPGTRRRAIAYLKELGLEHLIPQECSSPEALAEAELAEHLADPRQVGMAPMHMRLLDRRRLAWPGYHQPVDCYLFEFRYELPSRSFTGVGIAGPVVHSFLVDMQDLSPRDIYAAYAGWSVEDPHLGEVAAEDFTDQQAQLAQQAQQEIAQRGYEEVRVVKLGQFYGQQVPVAVARRGGQLGVVVWDGKELLWFPATGGARPLGPNEAWHIYKGRRLLDSFNGPQWWR